MQEPTSRFLPSRKIDALITDSRRSAYWPTRESREANLLADLGLVSVFEDRKVRDEAARFERGCVSRLTKPGDRSQLRGDDKFIYSARQSKADVGSDLQSFMSILHGE